VTLVADRAWQSYDSVAGAYHRFWDPYLEPVAHDLVDLVGVGDLPADLTVLDVGTGTGVVAREVVARVPRSVVIGIDPSSAMLALARTSAALASVAAEAPGLPFADGVFDVALANLVLSHFTRYEISLTDMVRVLQPGGRLGVTAWGTLDDAPVDDRHQRELTRIWMSMAERFVDTDAAADVIDAALPWEGWFGDPAHLRGALEGAGLRDVALHGRTYRTDVTQREMLAGHETSFWGRFLHGALGDDDWRRFRHDVTDAARVALPEPITRVDQLLIGVGVKRFDGRP
jgi:ubiquinone/menaquinone biosynthesis C-methylase UbiE